MVAEQNDGGGDRVVEYRIHAYKKKMYAAQPYVRMYIYCWYTAACTHQKYTFC